FLRQASRFCRRHRAHDRAGGSSITEDGESRGFVPCGRRPCHGNLEGGGSDRIHPLRDRISRFGRSTVHSQRDRSPARRLISGKALKGGVSLPFCIPVQHRRGDPPTSGMASAVPVMGRPCEKAKTL